MSYSKTSFIALLAVSVFAISHRAHAAPHCPDSFNTVDFGVQTTAANLQPGGTRLRVVFNSEFLLTEDADFCTPTPGRVGEDGLPIPIVYAVQFAEDVLRRPTERLVLKGHAGALAREQSRMMTSVRRQAIDVDKQSEASGVDLLDSVPGGECYTSAPVRDGLFCMVANPFVAEAPFIVECSDGQCGTASVAIGRGLSMELEWETQGTTPEAMAVEVEPKIAEVYVFLMALLMP